MSDYWKEYGAVDKEVSSGGCVPANLYALPTQEQMRKWKEAFSQLEDQVREQQFQKARLRALVEDVAKLAGVRIKVSEDGE